MQQAQKRKAMDDTGAERLAEAIVKQAADDYKMAQIQSRRPKQRYVALARMRECERFFRSDWFRALTGLDGEAILQQLRREGE